eukprot:1187134-Prorocentrum_minimum.AAC.1
MRCPRRATHSFRSYSQTRGRTLRDAGGLGVRVAGVVALHDPARGVQKLPGAVTRPRLRTKHDLGLSPLHRKLLLRSNWSKRDQAGQAGAPNGQRACTSVG